MPLQAGHGGIEPGEQRVGAACPGEADLHDADLGLGHRLHPAAERIGEELMAEADAEERHAPGHRLADDGLLVGEPGVGVLLEDIHRPAHGDEPVIAVERRNRLALVELHRVPGDAVGAHEVAEDAGMLDLDVLEHEELHRRALRGCKAIGTHRPPPPAAQPRRPGRRAPKHSRAPA